jgi:hypothetical protein
MPKAKVKEMKPVMQEEEDDLSKEDYADKDKFVEDLLDEDEEENVEEGGAPDDDAAPSAAIDTGDDF